jgi:hypothetical protein
MTEQEQQAAKMTLIEEHEKHRQGVSAWKQESGSLRSH